MSTLPEMGVRKPAMLTLTEKKSGNVEIRWLHRLAVTYTHSLSFIISKNKVKTYSPWYGLWGIDRVRLKVLVALANPSARVLRLRNIDKKVFSLRTVQTRNKQKHIHFLIKSRYIHTLESKKSAYSSTRVPTLWNVNQKSI